MHLEIGVSGISVEMGVSTVLWLIANWVYLDLRRAGTRGFKRLLAFFLGFPTTVLLCVFVEEGSEPRIRDDGGDVDELVREIREDRLLREEHGRNG
ncbi:MAG TPA: hypothetical protein VE173_03345 [Longimicrobiales bacterium]|nr:hypothetical protein [Longimicrobiales bacterium]